MRLKYDLNVGALYVSLADGTVARTQDIDDNTSVDLDDAGAVVGIEVISIAHPWALDGILRAYSVPAAEAAQLRAYFQPVAPGTILEVPAMSIEVPAMSIERNAPIRVAA